MTTPLPYQLVGAKQIRAFGGRALLADDMGLGKTFQALYWAWKMPNAARPLVVVCPENVKINWQREALKHFGMPASVISGSRPKRKSVAALAGAAVVIINYDILGGWLDYLRAMDPQAVFVDEVHYIKNRESGRYLNVKALVRDVPYLVAISGTPMTNRPAELWPVLNLLRPDVFDSFFTFAHEYAKPKKMPWGWSYGGGKNLEKLHALLTELCMIRRLKKDVLHDLPDKKRIIQPVPIARAHEYARADADFLGWLKEISPERAKRAARAVGVTRVGYLMRLAARLKVAAVFQWIDDFLEREDGKLIVFTMHTPMIEALQRRYGKLAVTVNGGVRGHERQLAVDQFQTDPRKRLFFGNPTAAGVGITLTAAQTVLFTDWPWTPGELMQCEDRIHRIGQNKQTFFYYLIAAGTIEEDVVSLLWDKQEVLEQVLNGKRKEDLNELDIFAELIDRLNKRSKGRN